MRFGIPTEYCVQVQHGIDANRSPIGSGRQINDPFSNPPSIPTASQILSESLTKLEAIHISSLSKKLEEKSQKWQKYLQSSTSSIHFNMSLIDQELEREIKGSQSDVKMIIENQIRLQEEEKRRLLALQQEKERKLKEEAERKRLELEAAEKRLKEERKLAEQKRIADEKRFAEEQALKKQKDEQDLLESKKREMLKAKAEREAAAKKASAFANPLEIEKMLLGYRKDIQDIKLHIVDELSKDKELKKAVGVIKRKINIKLGQLSSSRKQLDQISKDIIGLIQPLVAQPLAYKWILNFVSKAIVSQAETEVIVKPSAALPLGRLTCDLLHNLDGLDYYLSARFVKKCCLIIGFIGTIDTEEGRVRMGWRRSDGKWESEVKYEERMGGILSVWAVVGWVNHDSSFRLFNMKAEWTFLARLLNAKPDLLGDVHFVAVCNWWEASADKFYSAYGKQAQKLLSVAVTEWAALGTAKSFPAATRLQILGEDLFKKNNFNSIKEMEY